jgi:hypothetical protein
MSNRSIRRATERQAQKAAAQTQATTIPDAQLAANRANAQMSTGPKSENGKLISSHNALKTGLTGRTIVLPTDDVAAYQSLVAVINRKFAPADDYEKHLVQTMLAEQAPTDRPETIADTEWRLLRIPTLEAGLYALGRTELAAECAHEPDPQLRASMLEAHIFRTYQRTSATSPCKNAASAINSNSSPPNSSACRKNAAQPRRKKPNPSRPLRKLASIFQIRRVKPNRAPQLTPPQKTRLDNPHPIHVRRRVTA